MMANIDPRRVIKGLTRVVDMLEKGEGVKVIKSGSKIILRVEWLNLYVDPEILFALSSCIVLDAVINKGLAFDAVTSIETSGAKYGVAVALISGRPYFSLHKVEKITFEEPISARQLLGHREEHY